MSTLLHGPTPVRTDSSRSSVASLCRSRHSTDLVCSRRSRVVRHASQATQGARCSPARRQAAPTDAALVEVRGRLPDLPPVLRRLRTATASATSRASGATSTTCAWLGVDAIWLSPFFRSPMADFGYDVSDYCDVDPLFGTLDDFDASSPRPTRAGIRVLVDWVPNHTSDQHPWFVGVPVGAATTPSATGTSGATRAPDGGPPNNWRRGLRRDASRPGPSTRPPASTTCTCSCPSSPT